MTDEVENKSERSCANCACHSIQEDQTKKGEFQLFCRRDPPMAQRVRAKVPVMRDGQPVLQRGTDKPLMTEEEMTMYLYRPTMPALVCYDGWRPMGTEPGARVMDGVTEAFQRLYKDMMADQVAALNLPMPGDFPEPIGFHIGPDGKPHDGPDAATCILCNPQG